MKPKDNGALLSLIPHSLWVVITKHFRKETVEAGLTGKARYCLRLTIDDTDNPSEC